MKHNLYFIFCLICLSCSNKNEDKIKLEQQVFQDIFPELVEKTFQDFRKLPKPPPPPLSSNMTNMECAKEYKDKEEMDETFRQYRINHKIYLDTTDFVPLNIIVHDSVLGYNQNQIDRYSKKTAINNIDSEELKNSFKIDLDQILIGKDYILKYKSAFPQNMQDIRNEQWKKYPPEKKHLHQFSGELLLYRIYFNNEFNEGFTSVGFYCGNLCGCSYLIKIKKKNSKWEIDFIENLGCA